MICVRVLIAALLFEEMASALQVCQNKRAREDYWYGGLALPDTKRMNSGLALTQDSDLMALLDEIDNLDAYNSNPEDTDAVNELNVVTKAREDEIGLEAQAENKIESPEEKDSADQMGSYKRGELTPDGSNSEATSACEIGDMTYYYSVPAELGFFAEHIYPNELGIIVNNYIDGDSMADIMCLDAVHGNAEITEDFYGSLWDNDIWQLNEHSVIQNDFESPQKEEVGFVVRESEFNSIQRLSENKGEL